MSGKHALIVAFNLILNLIIKIVLIKVQNLLIYRSLKQSIAMNILKPIENLQNVWKVP